MPARIISQVKLNLGSCTDENFVLGSELDKTIKTVQHIQCKTATKINEVLVQNLGPIAGTLKKVPIWVCDHW